MTEAMPKTSPPSKRPKLKSLPISALRIDHELQQRADGLDRATVRKYVRKMRQGETFPAITIGLLGKAHYLIDGWHRVAAYEQIGAVVAEAEVYRFQGRDEMMLFSLTQSNNRHGKSLTRKDKQAIWTRYVESEGYLTGRGTIKSSRMIAADLDHVYDQSTIWKKLKALNIDAPRDGIKEWSRDADYGDDDIEAFEDSDTNALSAFRDALQAARDHYSLLAEDDAKRMAIHETALLNRELEATVPAMRLDI